MSFIHSFTYFFPSFCRSFLALLCYVPDTDLFSFSRRARVHWSCSLSWCSRWASSMCCPQGDSWSRAGLEWRRRYWSSSLSPPHRRQHTEPPAHSQPAAPSRAKDKTGRGQKQSGQARRGEVLQDKETMRRDWPGWKGHQDGGRWRIRTKRNGGWGTFAHFKAKKLLKIESEFCFPILFHSLTHLKKVKNNSYLIIKEQRKCSEWQ